MTLAHSVPLDQLLPPLAGDGDALGVDGALVRVEVEHLLLRAGPGRVM